MSFFLLKIVTGVDFKRMSSLAQRIKSIIIEFSLDFHPSSGPDRDINTFRKAGFSDSSIIRGLSTYHVSVQIDHQQFVVGLHVTVQKCFYLIIESRI